MTWAAPWVFATPTTIENPVVVVSDTVGAPLAAFADAAAAPTRLGLAPVNAITVIDPGAFRAVLATTVTVGCANGENAHQISASPSCVLLPVARVHTNGAPLVTELPTVRTLWTLRPAVSAETRATSNVFAGIAKIGDVNVVVGWFESTETGVPAAIVTPTAAAFTIWSANCSCSMFRRMSVPSLAGDLNLPTPAAWNTRMVPFAFRVT